MRKADWRGEWMLWAMPVVALSPLWLGRIVSAWPKEWRWSYKSEQARYSSCQSNLKQLGLAMMQYAQDYDQHYPPATIGGLNVGNPRLYLSGAAQRNAPTPVGWTGALLPYTRIQELQFCPAQRPERSQASVPSGKRSPASPGFVDYWLNARLAGRATSTLRAPSQTFLLGEGNDGSDLSNATYSKNTMPTEWLSGADSPLHRHLGGASYLWADGHVYGLNPTQAMHSGSQGDPFAP